MEYQLAVAAVQHAQELLLLGEASLALAHELQMLGAGASPRGDVYGTPDRFLSTFASSLWKPLVRLLIRHPQLTTAFLPPASLRNE